VLPCPRPTQPQPRLSKKRQKAKPTTGTRFLIHPPSSPLPLLLVSRMTQRDLFTYFHSQKSKPVNELKRKLEETLEVPKKVKLTEDEEEKSSVSPLSPSTPPPPLSSTNELQSPIFLGLSFALNSHSRFSDETKLVDLIERNGGKFARNATKVSFGITTTTVEGEVTWKDFSDHAFDLRCVQQLFSNSKCGEKWSQLDYRELYS
jgi:hypothetical protein